MSHGSVRSSTFARLAQLAVPHVWGGGTSVSPRSQTTRDRHDVQTCHHPTPHTPARGGTRRTRSSFAPQPPGGSRTRAQRVRCAWARAQRRTRARRPPRPPPLCLTHGRGRGARRGRNFEIAIFLSSPMLLVRGGTGEVEWRSDSLGKMLYGRARGSAGACVGEGAGGARARAQAGGGAAQTLPTHHPRAQRNPRGHQRPIAARPSRSGDLQLGCGGVGLWAQGRGGGRTLTQSIHRPVHLKICSVPRSQM